MTSWRGGAALSSRSVSMMVEMAMVVMMGRPLPSLLVQIGLQGALDDGLLQIKVGGFQFRDCKRLLLVHAVVGQSAFLESAVNLGLVRKLLGFVELHLIGQTWLQSRQTQAQSSRRLVGIDNGIVVIAIVITEADGVVGCLVFSLEDVNGIATVLRLVDLDGSVEKLRKGLYLWVVPMNAKDALPGNVHSEGFVRDELRKVLFILGHKVHAAFSHFGVVVGIAINLQTDSTEKAVAVTLLLDHLEATLLEGILILREDSCREGRGTLLTTSGAIAVRCAGSIATPSASCR